MKRFLAILLFAFISGQSAFALDIKPYLDACHTKGSVLLYDDAKNKLVNYNQYEVEEETLPASTFKILHTMIALDRNVATPQTVFKWDGVKREYEQWNQDLTLAKAFAYSAVWVHEKIKEQIPNDVYTRYLNWTDYGNGDITHGSKNNFWVRGNFKVTPQDQIDLLRGLYYETLPFSVESMKFVKSIMLTNDDKLGVVFSKTGWAKKDGKQIGWWVGYVERDNKPLFFATRLIADEKNDMFPFIECRKSVTRDVIWQYLRGK